MTIGKQADKTQTRSCCARSMKGPQIWRAGEHFDDTIYGDAYVKMRLDGLARETGNVLVLMGNDRFCAISSAPEASLHAFTNLTSEVRAVQPPTSDEAVFV